MRTKKLEKECCTRKKKRKNNNKSKLKVPKPKPKRFVEATDIDIKIFTRTLSPNKQSQRGVLSGMTKSGNDAETLPAECQPTPSGR